ncbi:neutral/alkaline ceramidase [Candidatus Uabimicrobium sp. HlEnr_7]|uniref:neutral/alkaline ceramidase n=1 Tax=Candidatus Uabimicrobium helgolandensis TaxID=3095367 RepID=UPI00355697B5
MAKLFTIFCVVLMAAQTISADNFEVGVGIHDVTGPAAEVGMMGYANVDQQTSGIHHRLWARAFVIKDVNGKRVVFVNVDVAMIMQAVKMKVVERLQKTYGDTYTNDNVMLVATHTHSGPGGFSHYALFNITILGFSKKNFDSVVHGICEAIIKAHDNVAPAKIKIARGQLENTVINRSLEAYNANIDANLHEPYDKSMTLLRFERSNGEEIGLLSWFAVHATSMGNQNKLINGDNKGWAQRKFDTQKNSDYRAKETFVSVFANSTLGDVSPNIYGGENGGGINDFASTNISGEKQFKAAWNLYHNATEELAPNTLTYSHTFANFSKMKIDPEFTNGKQQKTGYAALGIAFAAGAEDGPSNIPYIKEGDMKGHYDKVHGLKPIFLETGKMKPYPWTPEVLPVQMFVVGKIAILAVPGEFTTHAGRRVRETVQPLLEQIGVEHVILTGPANTYAGYVTTREEYNEQHYEGASTHFGQWTLAAFRQQFKILSEAIISGKKAPKGPSPRDLSGKQTEIQPGVVFDTPPLFGEFGDVKEDAPEEVERLSILKVQFWGAHPKNAPQDFPTFLTIQRKSEDSWKDVRYDYDLDTAFIWKRSGISASEITVMWDIPGDVPQGTYRIIHNGYYKNGISGKIKKYSGQSSEFEVIANTKLRISNCKVTGTNVAFQMQYPPATEDDLHHRQKFVHSGQIKFAVNGAKKLYIAEAVKGQSGVFRATVNEKIKALTVDTRMATDSFGNGNQRFQWSK